MIDLLDDDSTSTSPRSLLDQPGPRGVIVADWAAASRQGRTRLSNEDSWLQRGPIFALADGMGGLEEGLAASTTAVEATVAYWLAALEPPPDQVAHVANDAVRANRPPGVKSGTTLSAVRIARDQATVINVGDSRVYRIRNGHGELITRDHNLRSELLAAGILPESAESLGPLRALTSYVGMDPAKLQVDVRSVALYPNDRIIVCTDGVHAMPHSEFMQHAVDTDVTTTADNLTGTGSQDDATVIVIDIGHVTPPHPPH